MPLEKKYIYSIDFLRHCKRGMIINLEFFYFFLLVLFFSYLLLLQTEKEKNTFATVFNVAEGRMIVKPNIFLFLVLVFFFFLFALNFYYFFC